MPRILVVMENRSNRQLLCGMLAEEFEIRPGTEAADLASSFDLAIIDALSLERHKEWVQIRREEARPLFLPFLLLVSRPDIGYATRQLWTLCDDLIRTPIEKIELRARVHVLLRARAFSREMERRYYMLARSAPLGVFLLKGSTVAWVNPYLEDLLHRPAEALVGEPWDEWFLPEDRPAVRQWPEGPGNEDFSAGRIVKLSTPGGIRWAEVRVAPVGPTERQGFLGVLTDVTGEREVARIKDEFLGTISHELRTPLTAILGFSEFLLRHLREGDEARECADHIHIEAEQLAQKVDDLLNLAHFRAGRTLPVEKNTFDLLEAVERLTVRFRRNHPERNFVLRSPAAALPVFADRALIVQALTNLLGNALKFSPKGTQVEVEVGQEEGTVRIEVIDKGIGMSAEEKERVADVFYRTDSSTTAIGGFGLGLTVVKAIMDAHKGSLEIDSAPGKGTRVIMILPGETLQRH